MTTTEYRATTPCTVEDGETRAEHLARTNCGVSPESWARLQRAISRHDAGEPDHVAELARHVAEKYTAAMVALRGLHDVVAAVREQQHAVEATVRAEVSFVAFALLHDDPAGGSLVDHADVDRLLTLAADVRGELNDLLEHAGNVLLGDPDDEDDAA